MDTLKAMQAFVGVVDTGGFTSAADLLKMPKATLSAAVAELEGHLKVRLLHRTTRKVTVTADGAAYYERAVRILEDLRDAEESFSSNQATPRGKLKVDVSTAVASHLLIPLLHTFLQRYPDVELELGCSDRPLNLLSEGIDCALRIGEVTDPSVVTRRVGTMNVVTCATPGYIERHGRPLHPNDLKKHVCLNYVSQRTGQEADWEFIRGDERLTLPVKSALTLNDSGSYIQACAAGLGVARVPTYIFQNYPSCGGRVELLLCDWRSDDIPFHVVYPSNRHLSSKVRAFVDWVAEVLECHTGLQMCDATRAKSLQPDEPQTMPKQSLEMTLAA